MSSRHLSFALVLTFAVAGSGCRHSEAANVAPGPVAGSPSTKSTEPAPTKRIDLDLDGVNLQDAARAIATQAGVNFSVDPDLTEPVTFHARAIPWDQALEQLAREHSFRIIRAGPVLRLTRSADAPAEYSGEPVDVAFEDTPIREVAAVFSELAKVPIVVDEDVQTLVTQRSRKLPWDFVLDHIARKYGLRIVRNVESLRVTKG